VWKTRREAPTVLLQIRPSAIALVALALCWTGAPALAQEKPNVVLVFMDNFGWGELADGAEVPTSTDPTRGPGSFWTAQAYS
jgi:hypothetical protein